jgi:uncharacterized membrane protein
LSRLSSQSAGRTLLFAAARHRAAPFGRLFAHIIRPFFCADPVDARAGRRVTESKIWLIKRNCSASPRQLAVVLVSLVAVSFAFGVAFAAQGLWMVLPFVALELLAVAAAFVCYGRRAADFERIELRGSQLVVERHEGSQRSELVFDLPWVKVDVSRSGAGTGARVKVELVSARSRVEVGQLLVEGRRAALGNEIRAALVAATRQTV